MFCFLEMGDGAQAVAPHLLIAPMAPHPCLSACWLQLEKTRAERAAAAQLKQNQELMEMEANAKKVGGPPCGLSECRGRSCPFIEHLVQSYAHTHKYTHAHAHIYVHMHVHTHARAHTRPQIEAENTRLAHKAEANKREQQQLRAENEERLLARKLREAAQRAKDEELMQETLATLAKQEEERKQKVGAAGGAACLEGPLLLGHLETIEGPQVAPSSAHPMHELVSFQRNVPAPAAWLAGLVCW